MKHHKNIKVLWAVCVFTALSGFAIFFTHNAFAQSDLKTKEAAMQAEYLNTVHELSLPAAQKLLGEGLDLAVKKDVKIAIAVVDRAGDLLAFVRMDGAAIVTVDVAIGKARTAVFIKGPSKKFEDMINSGAPSMATTPSLLPLQGGMPVLFNGEVVGAIGISGSSGDSDQALAASIAESFDRL